MKALAGSTTGTVQADQQRCYELLADVERYPSWYPELVPAIAVAARGESGTPTQVDASLRFAYGPLGFDSQVPMTVVLEPASLVWMHRVPDDDHDPEQFQVKWLLNGGEAATELRLELSANLDLPPFIPGLSAIADEVARGFLHAAANHVESGAA